jgi:hypothetical protein
MILPVHRSRLFQICCKVTVCIFLEWRLDMACMNAKKCSKNKSVKNLHLLERTRCDVAERWLWLTNSDETARKPANHL